MAAAQKAVSINPKIEGGCVQLAVIQSSMNQPDAVMSTVRNCVSNGGDKSTLAKVMGRRWPWLMEMHLYYFSPRTLGRLLQQNGFAVVRSSAQGRYLRLGYFVTRLGPYNHFLAQSLLRLSERLNLSGVAIPVNFGDLFTIYARRI